MRFGGLVAVDDVSFAAGASEITAIIGPNGAGKTTVFNCLTGFYQPSVGRLALARDGRTHLLERMDGFRIAREAGVARTFQNIRLFAGMTVLENLIVAQHNRADAREPLLGRAACSACRSIAAPRRTRSSRRGTGSSASGWSSAPTTRAGSLPYGAQRRLEIARAMCIEPALLCLDEPAAGLNPREIGGAHAAAARHPRRAAASASC